MKKAAWLAYSFAPEKYEAEIGAILKRIEQRAELDDSTLHRILSQHPKDGRAFFSKSELLRGAKHLAERELWQGDYAELVGKIRVKPVRTESGVTPITVLTQPWPCPGRCIFCPNDPAMPKSYLSKEPGAQRAERHRFDPYAQVTARLSALDQMGHVTSKVELIVLGGTWSSYPRRYQLWFVARLFEALNDFSPHYAEATSPASAVAVSGLRVLNSADEDWGNTSPRALQGRLIKAQQRNESARCRAVGLTVETRPDHVSEGEVQRLRELGCTRVQIGYQSLDDRVLELNERGHDVETCRVATRRLRRAGFKIQAHFMLNLYGSSPEQDLLHFERLFSDPALCPDELKLYPCMLIHDTALEAKYRAGEWRPYAEPELTELLVECLRRIPSYCRVSRMVRDIPGQDMVVGKRVNGLRDTVEALLRARGFPNRDIRAREIRRGAAGIEHLRLAEHHYATDTSDEVFLQYVHADEALVAFLRLSLPKQAAFLSELDGAALIREVHVYGASVPVGQAANPSAASQHAGLGRRLLLRSAELARQCGFRRLAVISAVGTRDYYRSAGFRDGPLYQHRDL